MKLVQVWTENVQNWQQIFVKKCATLDKRKCEFGQKKCAKLGNEFILKKGAILGKKGVKLDIPHQFDCLPNQYNHIWPYYHLDNHYLLYSEPFYNCAPKRGV